MDKLVLEKLIKDLNDVCNKLDRKYHINSGGCCYTAYILMKNLERFKINCRLVIYSDTRDIDEEDFYYNIRNRETSTNGLGAQVCWHYFVEIPEISFINQDDCDYRPYMNIVSVKSRDVKWIYKTGHWNNEFSRKACPMIGRRIKEVFNKYENFL